MMTRETQLVRWGQVFKSICDELRSAQRRKEIAAILHGAKGARALLPAWDHAWLWAPHQRPELPPVRSKPVQPHCLCTGVCAFPVLICRTRTG